MITDCFSLFCHSSFVGLTGNLIVSPSFSSTLNTGCWLKPRFIFFFLQMSSRWIPLKIFRFSNFPILKTFLIDHRLLVEEKMVDQTERHSWTHERESESIWFFTNFLHDKKMLTWTLQLCASQLGLLPEMSEDETSLSLDTVPWEVTCYVSKWCQQDFLILLHSSSKKLHRASFRDTRKFRPPRPSPGISCLNTYGR